MSFAYTLRESVSGFRRAKLSSLLSVATISISLILVGIFAAVTINASRLITSLRSRLDMEAFLTEPVSEDDVAGLQGRIAGLDGVEKVVFVSKDEAMKIFKQETGDDITRVLDFNPLPPSFKITLREPYRTSAKTLAIYDRVAALPGVDTVLYRRVLLELIDQRAASVNKVMLGLGIAVSLTAIFLVANTIRLAITGKRRLIRTMELVGATRGFIRRPFIIEGVLQGFIGGLAASGLMLLLFEYATRLVTEEFAPYLRMPTLFYIAVVGTGMLLGLAGSVISVLRFVRPAAAE
ncbi:MAG TPA: permease-like cell division protein FtsX [Bacteroidota bacterium]|nr:permease-like cell division protein FtsX [Bacteroidota bacterium]